MARLASRLVPSRLTLRTGLAATAVALVGACATGEAPPKSAPTTPTIADEASDTGFTGLPGWDGVDHAATLRAFRLSCPRFSAGDQPEDAPVGPPYAGTFSAWRTACAAADESVSEADAKAFFEQTFVPIPLARASGEKGFTTAYYEPVIEVRSQPQGVFREPLLARPDDLTTFDVPADRYGQTTRTEVFKRTGDGTLVLYDERATIRSRTDIPHLGYGRVSDVTFLQIQGSGRATFEDGRQVRIAFAAHNGLPYRSIARELIDRGVFERHAASNDAVKAWLEANAGPRADSVLNTNPRFAFFSMREAGDPSIGAVGAANVPLTAHASMAIDPNHHLIGGLYVVVAEGQGAPEPHFAVAQDTGGAILGPLRSDLYFGVGPEAGAAASRISHATTWTALVPRAAIKTRSEARAAAQAILSD